MFDNLKETSVDLKVVRMQLDSRRKLTSLEKVFLPILVWYDTLGHVAKIGGISTKYLQQLIKNQNDSLNEEVSSLMKIWKSDSKYDSQIKWFEENKKRVERGFEPLPIPTK